MNVMIGFVDRLVRVFECLFGLGKYAWVFLRSSYLSRAGAAARIVALESQLDVCLRRELLDHAIFFHEQHLRALMGQYVAYYQQSRPHQGLEGKCPITGKEKGEDIVEGKIVSIPILGGLHHRYERVAA